MQTDLAGTWRCNIWNDIISYINRYSARVSRAEFWSSGESPAISKSSRTIRRSAVSKPLGSRFFKKEVTLCPL